MSSFVRSNAFNKKTIGIPLLDKIITHLEEGMLILIKEDEYSYMHQFLINTWISEGVYNNENKILIVNKDNKMENKKFEVYRHMSNIDKEKKTSKMYIAWRYANIQLNNENSKFSLINKLTYSNNVLVGNETTMHSIKEYLNSDTNCRVAIYSLFSPSYDTSNIEKDLFNLKKIIRQQKHICFISIPTFFYENIIFNQYFDIVVSLDSNIYNNYLSNYKAVIYLEKLSIYKNLYENANDTFKFGIKFIKDKLVLEKIDIPPEDIELTKDCKEF